MHVTQTHATVSLYDRVATMLAKLGVGVVLDVGCADGVLRAALPPSGPRLIWTGCLHHVAAHPPSPGGAGRRGQVALP